MGTNTKISWCDATWNPVVGCTKISSGCDHCYAIRGAHRMAGNPNAKISARYSGLTHIVNKRPNWTGEVRLVADHLEDPLRWQKPRRVFVNSMSDLFHESVSFRWIDQIFAVMALSKKHLYQCLTKRPERMMEYLAENRCSEISDHMDPEWRDGRRGSPIVSLPLPNVHIGTSCEDQKTADDRIPHLLRCPAAVRWLSLEPLLGPIDISRYITCNLCGGCGYFGGGFDMESGDSDPGEPCCCTSGGRHAPESPINWVVVGAESGPGARAMDLDWVRSLRDQCQSAGVPFFFKQMIENGRKVELPELDGRVWAEYPA